MRNSKTFEEAQRTRPKVESGEFVARITHVRQLERTSGNRHPVLLAADVAGAIARTLAPGVWGGKKCSKHGSSSIRNGER